MIYGYLAQAICLTLISLFYKPAPLEKPDVKASSVLRNICFALLVLMGPLGWMAIVWWAVWISFNNEG